MKIKQIRMARMARMALVAMLVGAVGPVSGSEELVNEILPSTEEREWLEIDWKTDLWEARREAARTGKPIYLWEMDGHPLGCV